VFQVSLDSSGIETIALAICSFARLLNTNVGCSMKRFQFFAYERFNDVETIVINESLVSTFKYWLNDHIEEGMRYRNELFRRSARFKKDRRQNAFDFSWELSQKGVNVVITVSDYQYTVWADLRSPAELVSSHQIFQTSLVAS
jgi:protein tyrosine phosphatase